MGKTSTRLLDDPPRLVAGVRRALRAGLPGARAQALMSPRPRFGWVPDRVPPGLRQAAALLLLYARGGRPHVLLTRRRPDLRSHAGQVSLPGGSVDAGETVRQAALREAEEEVGLDPARVTVLGELTPLHIPASGFLLHAAVGWSPELGPLVLSDREVERVLEVPLAHLADPARLHVETWTLHGEPAAVPQFRVEGLPVWGATAMVLAELLTLLDHPPPVPADLGGLARGDTLSGVEPRPAREDTDPTS